MFGFDLFDGDDEDLYDIEVDQEEFYDVLESVKEDYEDVVSTEEDLEVEVDRTVADRPQRFHPMSCRLQGPVVIVEYRLEHGPQTIRTNGWAEYRDRDREEALEEAELDLPSYTEVRDDGADTF